MVVPNRHVGDLAATTADERAELMTLTRNAEIALTEAYTPHGINVGINLGRAAGAGVLDHLHVHLVPRWNGDTNFMTRRRRNPRAARRTRPDGGAAAADLRTLSADDCCARLHVRRTAGRITIDDHGHHRDADCTFDLTTRTASVPASDGRAFARDERGAARGRDRRDAASFRATDARGRRELGLLGVTIPGVGRRRPRLRELRAGDRGDRAGERDGGGHRSSVTNSLVAELIAHAGTDAAEASAGCGGWRRGEAIGAFALSDRRRHRRREPADARSRRRHGYRITGTKVWVANAEAADVAIVFAARSPACAARASPRFSCRWTRPGSRARRAPIRSACAASAAWISILDVHVDADQVLGPVDGVRGWRCGRSRAAAWRSRRRRSASGRRRSTRRSPTRSSASTFGQPIAQLPGDPVDARRHGDRARRGADADVEGRRGQGHAGALLARGVDGEAGRVRGRAQGRRQGDADPGVGRLPPRLASSSACSATCAPPRSTRARPKRSA